jgi:fumarate reductase (CoM/CoB) subunit A
MEKYLPLAKEWGLRDPTSRAIYLENVYGRGSVHGGAYLSVTHLPRNLINEFLRKEPRITSKFKKAGIDVYKDAIECGPGCHYSMGGVRVNENCETNLPRLYAIGEVAAGMDGAERIDGGPAITWCLTTGYIAGKEAPKKAKELDWINIDLEQVNRDQKWINLLWKRKEGIKGFEVKNKIKDIMWKYCALVKDGKGLEEALSMIQQVKSDDLPRLCIPDSSKVYNKGLVEAFEAINLTELSEMVVRASFMRQESRRSHYRTDFPNLDNKEWLRNTVIKKENGMMTFTRVSPVMTRMQPLETKESVE